MVSTVPIYLCMMRWILFEFLHGEIPLRLRLRVGELQNLTPLMVFFSSIRLTRLLIT